jgi:outer membrane immunogenic protein
MKTLIAAATAAIACVSLPALANAQDTSSPSTYGTLGYSQASEDGVDLGAIQGRLGARWNHFGVEGELAGGVKSDDVNVGGTNVNVKLRHAEAIYGVGYLPVSPNFDLFARVGYGNTDIKASASGVAATGNSQSWNYGVGGQYFFTPKDGVRVDYTRYDFTDGGDNADVWGVSYVRKF